MPPNRRALKDLPRKVRELAREADRKIEAVGPEYEPALVRLSEQLVALEKEREEKVRSLRYAARSAFSAFHEACLSYGEFGAADAPAALVALEGSCLTYAHGSSTSGSPVGEIISEILDLRSRKIELAHRLDVGGMTCSMFLGGILGPFLIVAGGCVFGAFSKWEGSFAAWFLLVLFAIAYAMYYVFMKYFPGKEKGRIRTELEGVVADERRVLGELERRVNDLSAIIEAGLTRQYDELIRKVRKERNDLVNRLRSELQQWLKGWKEGFDGVSHEAGIWGRGWNHAVWQSWQPVEEPAGIVRLGTFTREADWELEEVSDLNAVLNLPAFLALPEERGLLLKASGAARDEAIKAVQNVAFRFLASVPPGKLRFLFIDPVGLGANAASLLNLKDYDESEEDSLVGAQAWVEGDHIRRQLLRIKEHIATVVQERLRDQYADIESYNQEAGEVAVPYQLVVVFDFPANFNEESAKDLLSIAQTGPRVGVYPVIVMDPGRKPPYGFSVEELERILTVIEWDGQRWVWRDEDFTSWSVNLDTAPPKETAELLINRWGTEAKEGMLVRVPFDKMLEAARLESDVWWRDSTRDGLEIPLGPITARKPQRLILGRGTWNHGLIVGRTGSGKSNLMHVIITAAALKYPPDELQMYLVDLKTVEFTAYRDLPHAVAVAIDADREFALSVLEGLDQEMRERMDAFRSVGANDVAEYRDKTREVLPRILLIVDEFQVLFEQDDRIAQEANRLLDRLARQGRAFGIHVLLGSQSLGGHSLPRATLDQMAVRIALQCSEADSRLVLAEDNPAARRLSRPGQAIYNSANGLVEGNTEFQVALFDDEHRSIYARHILELAEKNQIRRKPILFEGNLPARLEECKPLLERLEAAPLANLRSVETWLGERVSIRPPVSVRWSRRSGNHLLVVTRDEEEGVGVVMASVVGLCAQYPADRLQVYIADFSTPDAKWAGISETLASEFPHTIRLLGRRELIGALQELKSTVETSAEGVPPREDRYLVLVGLQRMRDLRIPEPTSIGWGEEAVESPHEQLAAIIRDGPEFGVHVLVWCDAVSNLRRSMERKTLGEIGFRVAGPMGEQDSMEILDHPGAARLDKPHRMLFYDDERPGEPEKFRPYILEDVAWLSLVGRRLRER
jgi:hypothetical protein